MPPNFIPPGLCCREVPRGGSIPVSCWFFLFPPTTSLTSCRNPALPADPGSRASWESLGEVWEKGWLSSARGEPEGLDQSLPVTPSGSSSLTRLSLVEGNSNHQIIKVQGGLKCWKCPACPCLSPCLSLPPCGSLELPWAAHPCAGSCSGLCPAPFGAPCGSAGIPGGRRGSGRAAGGGVSPRRSRSTAGGRTRGLSPAAPRCPPVLALIPGAVPAEGVKSSLSLPNPPGNGLPALRVSRAQGSSSALGRHRCQGCAESLEQRELRGFGSEMLPLARVALALLRVPFGAAFCPSRPSRLLGRTSV